jgi:competence protein ComGC
MDKPIDGFVIIVILVGLAIVAVLTFVFVKMLTEKFKKEQQSKADDVIKTAIKRCGFNRNLNLKLPGAGAT